MKVDKWVVLKALTFVVVTATTGWGQLVITGFHGNGELTVTGLWSNASCRVEWAPSMTGQWSRSWEDLADMPTGTNTAMLFRVPMFYRVVMTETPEGMVMVPGATFQMGWAGVAAPVHEVTLSSFCLAEYETTYALWHEVKIWAATNGYSFAYPGREGKDGTIGAAPTAASNEPVTWISWRDAVVWCNARSEKEGLTPVYTCDGITVTNASDATACDNAAFSAGNNGYRLPTEAEWECAARYWDGATWTPGGHASGATNDYNDAGACQAVAWYSANSGVNTHPVGLKYPNQLMIHDMSGNVREWCWDWATNYPGWWLTDPAGPPTGSRRVSRGGAWNDTAWTLRCAERTSSMSPEGFDTSTGFRCAKSLD